jgi:CheY-like chemotaxis protein
MNAAVATRTALVIDDDPFLAELVQVLLESRGFSVDVMTDGIEALELERHYDVILLDVNMPVFDGERLTAYWKLTQEHVLRRVIILSGYAKRSEAFSGGAFATLQKPFAHEALLAAVEACVAQTDGF